MGPEGGECAGANLTHLFVFFFFDALDKMASVSASTDGRILVRE